MASNLKPFKILITDVDGILTDGKIYYSSEGKILKEFGPHDSDGIKFFKRFGIKIAAVTADKRGFDISKRRMDDMNIPLFHVPESSRLEGVLKVADGCPFAFIGDGYHDIKVFDSAEISYTTLNALDIVRDAADVVLQTYGGSGALMSVFEHYLSLHDDLNYTLFKKGAL